MQHPRTLREWIRALVLVTGTLHVPIAAAQRAADPVAPSLEQQADAHFERAVKRHDAGEHALALAEFQKAYALRPSFQLLFNIGQVHYQLGHYASARVALQGYLDQGRDAIGSDLRVQIEQQLSRLRARTAELDITVNVAGAEVRVNDEPVGTSPLTAAAIVEPGTQRVGASKSGYRSARSTIVVTAGAAATVDLALVAPAPDPPAEPNHLPATWAWVSAGALAAGAIGTGLATAFASRRYDEMRKEALSDSPAAAREQLDEQRSSVSTLAITTDILALSSLAAAGLALYFTLSTPSSGDGGGQIQAQIGPNGIYTWLDF